MSKFKCPYLKSEVELSEERESHIQAHHPDLLPAHRGCIIQTVADPDEVRKNKRFENALLFSRLFKDLKGGKHVVVVVVSDTGKPKRNWVITSYMTRKLAEGEMIWERK